MAFNTTKHSLFATTRWTLVNNAACEGDQDAVEAFGKLFATYWQPLYRYVRRLGNSSSDAEDLVQGFFIQLLENAGLNVVDRTKGRFRAFLLASLKNYIAGDWRRRHRLKRGGFAVHHSIDWKSAEAGLGVEPADSHSPDLLYDREWALALLDKVLDDMSKDERQPDFPLWKPYLSINSDQISYVEIAAQFGMTEGAARIAVHRWRKKYRQRLREEIRRTLNSEDMVEDEMHALFEALVLTV